MKEIDNICLLIADKIVDLIKIEEYPYSGVFVGKPGILLYFNELYNITKKENIKQEANKLFDDILLDLRNKELHHGLSAGITGAAWIFNYLLKNNFIESEISENLIKGFDKHLIKAIELSAREQNYDLLTGYLGPGLYFTERLNSRYSAKAFNLIIDNLTQNIQYDDNGAFFYELYNHDKTTPLKSNLGLAHGIPSIIIFLCKLYSIEYRYREKLKSIIEECVAWILHKEKKGESLYPDKFPSGSPTRLSWCYGDLCISLMLYHCAITLDRHDWMKKGREIAIHSCNRRDLKGLVIWDFCFCHGTLGIAYIFKKLYTNYQSNELLDASNYWYNLTLDKIKTNPYESIKTLDPEKKCYDFNPFLLEGLSGIGLSLLAYHNDLSKDWEKVFLTN